jgi:hypothetical protein
MNSDSDEDGDHGEPTNNEQAPCKKRQRQNTRRKEVKMRRAAMQQAKHTLNKSKK